MEAEPNNGISLLPDDVFVEIFLCLGAPGTAKCAMVSKRLNTLSNDSLALWRHFLMKDYNLQQQKEIHQEKEIMSRNEDEEGNNNNHNNIEWGKMYRYISSRSRQHNILCIPARVVFADDGISYPGFSPQNVFNPQKEAWCTSSGVDKNVDLVAELPTTCLVTGFIAENGDTFYTAPLEKALVFASFEEPPNLELGKKYNNSNESNKWVKKLINMEEMESVERDSRTVMFIQNRVLSSSSNNNNNKKTTAAATSEQQQQQQQQYQPLAAFQFPSNYHDCINTKFQYNCSPPTIARYIHFKLLNSIHPEGMFSTNIDLLNLTILGITLPDLQNMMLLHSKREEDEKKKDPSYERMHKCRQQFPLF